MKNVEISRSLIEKAAETFYDYGNESYILKTDHNTLYKIFKENDKEVLENKFQKIIRIPEKKIEFFANPISTISCDGEFVGFEMIHDKKEGPWWHIPLTANDKVYYLQQLKDKLITLEDKGITYSDIKDDNILINPKTKELKFCDVDNISIDGYETDLLQPVLKVTGIKNGSTIHSLMHNLYTLDQLECPGIYYEDVMYMLDRYELFNFTDKGYEILNEMSGLLPKTKAKEYSNRYLIDTLK